MYYNITEIETGVYRLTSAEAVFCELIVGEDKALLFDTGWGLGPLFDTVKEITDKPLIVVNSHGHVDHVCGNNQFEGDIYIHPKDMELVLQHGSTLMKGFILQKIEGDQNFTKEGFDKEAYLKEGKITYIPVEEGHIFDLGGKTLEVVELAGHTRGSIGLLYKEKKILFAGDAINGCLLLSGPESASMGEYIETLKKAMAMDFTEMFGGHRAEAFDKGDIAKFLKVAQSAAWDKAEPYRDPNTPDAAASDTVRVMCAEGMGLGDIQNPEFACIVFTEDKLKQNAD